MDTIAIDAIGQHAIDLRREIHRHPELGFEEVKTAALIERELDGLGIEHHRVATTGVVGVIRGALPGKTSAIRGDMDALPLQEDSGDPNTSQVPNKMHACGHDAHVAMVLGAARDLQENRASLHGNVVLLFQPAEEGPGGAEPMIAEGVLDNPKVDAVAMLHVDVRIPTGSVSITPGPVNAAADEIQITIRGKGGHGAAPHRAQDTIPAAAATILALQNIAARETDPLASVVVTIGTLEGGFRNNIIADKVHMTGTVRTTDPVLRNEIEARLNRIIGGVTAAYGVNFELEVIYGYPPVVNNPTLAESLAAHLRETTPIVVERLQPTMGAEDFAYFAQRVPGVLVRLGVYNEAVGATFYVHSPQFKLDEGAIPVGIRTLAAFCRGVNAGKIPTEK